jgi:hypothetical protein
MFRTRPRIRPTVAVVAAATVALLPGAMPGPAVAKKKPKPKPHLVLEKVKVHAPRYAFHGDRADFTLSYVVKNTGTATAPKTRTTLEILRPTVGSNAVINMLTPHLAPGRSFRGAGHQSFDVFAALPLGGWRIAVCADRTHKLPPPRSRCAKTGRFYIAEREWVGSVHGIGPVAGAALGEKWQSQVPAQLDFTRYLGHGAFAYDFGGTMDWTDHGINSGGCLWQGFGALAIDRDNAGPGITLDYGRGFYRGKETLQDRFFTLTASGGGGFPCHGSQPGPVQKTFLSIPKRSLRFGHTSLKGQNGTAAAENTQWKWSFH